MRTLLALALLSAALPLCAQTATPAPVTTRIDYPSVAAALKDLASRDGNGTVVTHPDGWTVINEPLASAQWSFTPAGHYAHPTVVRRVIKRGAGGSVAVDTASICEAPAAECDKLLAEFSEMNDRITQAVKARGRQGSTPPPQ